MIPAVSVSADQPGWQRREGRLWLANKPFSGWQYTLSATGDTLSLGAYAAGKAEGIHRQWYPAHRLKETRRYRNGWQEGEAKGWFPSGKPAFVYQFRNDVYAGRRQEWYADGQPARDGHYHDGQEAGLQRQWFADGSLKANYVVREGRTFGFTGVKNCVNVWDSITSH
jgi:antitoxin component YwqK of YwqJK toxin-antitoxin module